MKISDIVHLWWMFSVVYAKGLSSPIGASCLYTLNNLTVFPFCPGTDLSYACRCSNQDFLGSVLICVDDHSSEVHEVTKAYKFIQDLCQVQARIDLSFKALTYVFENATNNYIEENDYITGKISSPIRISTTTYDIAHRSVVTIIRHRMLSTQYGAILLGYWGVCLLLSCIYNIMLWCLPRILAWMNFTWIRWIRRHIITPHTKQVDFEKVTEQTTMQKIPLLVRLFQIGPTRIQTIVLCGYFGLMIILAAVDYRFTMPNPILNLLCLQRKVFIAIRCGVMAITQLPLIFLFSSRNNPFIKFTGMPYRTFNTFHKWISRLVFVLLVLHSFLYLDFIIRNGDYFDRWELIKFKFANAALISLFGLVCGSVYTLRVNWYEVFKGLHQILAAIFLAGIYYHCYTLGWMEYVYCCLGLLGYDYFMRVSKILLSGGVVYGDCVVVTEKGDKEATDKTVEEEPRDHPHSIKITIKHSGWWRPFLGCFIYIYFLKRNMFWESHPFTVIETSLTSNYNRLVVIIRVKNGVTKRLSNWIMEQQDRRAKIPMLVEGPYGSTIAFNGYDNALFIAGGIGFTIVYTHTMDLSRMIMARESSDTVVPTSNTHPIHLVWIIPSPSFIVTNIQEIESVLKMKNVNLKIYITRGDAGNSGLDEFLLSDDVLTYSRPAVRSLIEEYMERDSRGPTAIVSCGPDRLNYEARICTSNLLKRNIQRIDYFEEKLLW